MNELLTTAQAADRLGLAVRTVQRLAAQGQIKARKLAGHHGQYVFEPADVQVYKDELERRRREQEET